MANKANKTKALMRGSNHQPVPSFTEFSSQDVSGADIKSPFFYNTGVTGITVPVDAWEWNMSSTQLIRVSSREDMASYDEVAASTRQVWPCGNIDTIYIQGPTVGGTVTFHWNSL